MNRAPIDPSNCWPHIRTLLLRAAVQHLRRPRDGTAGPTDAAGQRPDTGGSGIVTATATEQMKCLRETHECSRRSPGAGSDTYTLPADPAAGHAVLSGGCDGTSAQGDGGATERSGVVKGGTDAHEGEGAPKSPLEAYVDQCAWRVLHAASRTASGGDSFFVVQVKRKKSRNALQAAPPYRRKQTAKNRMKLISFSRGE